MYEIERVANADKTAIALNSQDHFKYDDAKHDLITNSTKAIKDKKGI